MKVRFVYLYKSGRYYDSPEIVRIFSSMEKALNAVPKTFRENTSISIKDMYYAENNKSKKWLKITRMKLE